MTNVNISFSLRSNCHSRYQVLFCSTCFLSGIGLSRGIPEVLADEGKGDLFAGAVF